MARDYTCGLLWIRHSGKYSVALVGEDFCLSGKSDGRILICLRERGSGYECMANPTALL